MPPIQLEEVFRDGGQPSLAYVERVRQNRETYDEDLRRSIVQLRALCLLIGPSKTGKTWSWRSVLRNLGVSPIVLGCGKGKTTADLWADALEQLGVRRMSRSEHEHEGRAGLPDLRVRMPTPIGEPLEVDLQHLGGRPPLDREVHEIVLSNASSRHVLGALGGRKVIIVIENFHYLDSLQQQAFLDDWRVLSDDEIPGIIITTQQHVAEVIEANRELAGRIVHCELPIWTTVDLERIAAKGFELMKVEVSRDIIGLIAYESVGLPIQTQRICRGLLERDRITTAQPEKLKFSCSSFVVSEVCRDIWRMQYEHIYRPIYENLLAPLTDQDEARLGALMLEALATSPVVHELAVVDWTERVRSLPYERAPATSMVAVGGVAEHMLRDHVGPMEVLEWQSRSAKVSVVDPGFLFYLRWRFPADAIEPLVDRLQRYRRTDL